LSLQQKGNSPHRLNRSREVLRFLLSPKRGGRLAQGLGSLHLPHLLHLHLLR
jgi:hypothetical protein